MYRVEAVDAVVALPRLLLHDRGALHGRIELDLGLARLGQRLNRRLKIVFEEHHLHWLWPWCAAVHSRHSRRISRCLSRAGQRRLGRVGLGRGRRLRRGRGHLENALGNHLCKRSVTDKGGETDMTSHVASRQDIRLRTGYIRVRAGGYAGWAYLFLAYLFLALLLFGGIVAIRSLVG